MTDHDGLYVENMGGPHAYRHLHHLIRPKCTCTKTAADVMVPVKQEGAETDA